MIYSIVKMKTKIQSMIIILLFSIIVPRNLELIVKIEQ